MFGSVLGRAQGQTPPGNAARTAGGCRALGGGVLQHLADRPAVPAAGARSRVPALGPPTAREPPPWRGPSPPPPQKFADHTPLLLGAPILRPGRAPPPP